MKTVICLSAALVLGVVVSASLVASDDKEVTLKGTITCARCDLNKEAKCTTVIVVTQDDKEVVYYLDEKSGKAHHKEICMQGKAGSVTGVVSEKDGKKVITASKVAFD